MTHRTSDWPRIVAHADMDAFYAAIEQLDDPALRGRPVLVGANTGRGVVLTASYEARPFCVGSAMPMARARRKCPDAVIVPPRFERYREMSRAIMEAFSEFSPQVEALSLDEAFIDMTGAGGLFGDPCVIGSRLKEAVRAATGGLTASVGLSGTKYVAKVASAFAKPDGLTVVPPGEARGWLAPLPVSRLWGAGPKTQARLHRLGLQTIGDVAAADAEWLAAELGKAGGHFHALAHGRDPRPVEGRRPSKSVGWETTLAADVAGKEALKPYLRQAAEEIGRRLRRKGYAARGVRVKLKTSEFQVMTRQHRLAGPSDVAETIYSTGVWLLGVFDHPGPFRLVGMAAYDLEKGGDEAAQADLFGGQARPRGLETAIDALTQRFGPDIVKRADALSQRRGRRLSPNLDFLDDDGETE